jgi:nucleolar protein 56
MKFYLLETSFGLILFDGNGKIINKETFDLNIEKISDVYLSISKSKQPDSIKGFIEKLNKLNVEEIFIENQDLKNAFSSIITKRLVVASSDVFFKKLRENLEEKFAEIAPGIDQMDLLGDVKKCAELYTREVVKNSSEQNDAHVKYIVDTLDDSVKFINIYATRLREWYGIHFPELTDNLVSDIKLYAGFVTQLGTKDNFTVEKIEAIFKIKKEYAEEIVNRKQYSMGVSLTEIQLKMLQNLSKEVLSLVNFKDELERDLEVLLKDIAPNILTLLGVSLAGKLINLAGGLKPLALMPSSTIQVLGAEKALFRALKTNKDSPKHGIIFMWPQIRSAKYWQRGKISRLIAGKISICAKVDYFKGQYIGDKILKDTELKIQEIQKKFPEPGKKQAQKPRSDMRKGGFGEGQKPRSDMRKGGFGEGETPKYAQKKKEFARNTRNNMSHSKYKKGIQQKGDRQGAN